jgi:hypothetical protein
VRAPDVGVTALLLAVSALPIAGTLARVGTWDPSSVGLATAVAMLAGRELWHEILDGRRAR